MADPMADLFNEENIPQSNWFKFDKVGDRISGEVLEIFEKPAKDDFPAQRCFLLKLANGEQWNVGIKMTSDYLMGRTNNVQPGDLIGFEFKKEIPPAKKGFSPAKSIEVYVKKAAPRAESGTGDTAAA